MNLSDNEKKILLDLARKSIQKRFDNSIEINLEEIKKNKNLTSNLATFVTLTINGELRGCIGKMTAIQPLYKDVMENAQLAAFEDYRFYPLSRDEFDLIKIEISVLGPMIEKKFESKNALINYLNNEKPGVYIRKDNNSATFLPQVWEQIKKPQEFLSALCQKAGLDSNEWEKNDIKIFVYNVEKFTE